MKKIFAIALLALPLFALAQEDQDAYNESVIVTGTYRPVIENHDKINVAPAVPEPDTTLRHHFSYQNSSSHRMVSLYDPSRIKPARVIGEPRTKLYNNYFKLGLGNHWSPYFEAYLHSLSDRTSNYGVYLKHHSHWGKIGNEEDPESYYGPAHASQSDVNLFGNWIRNNKLRWSTNLAYQHDYNLYYGFNDALLQSINSTDFQRENLATSDYAAAYHFINWNGSVANIDNAPLGFHAALHAADLFGTYGQNEVHISFDGHADYAFQIAGKYDGRAGMAMQWDGVSQRYNADPDHLPLGFNSALPVDSINFNRNLFQFNPYGNLRIAQFDIHAGLRIAAGSYNSADTIHCYLFPDVTVSRSFFNNSLGITLGAQGAQTANDWNSNRLINPYLTPGYDLHGYRYNDLFLNIRYTINKRFEINAQVAYFWEHDLNSYRLDKRYTLNNVYTLYLEQEKGWQLGLDLAYTYNELLSANLGGHYYGQKTSTREPLLMGLTYDAYLNANLNIRDKFLVRLQSKLFSAMDADCVVDYVDAAGLPFYRVTEQIPVRFGLNLELEYRHTRALSFFARIDNLTWQHYYYYLNYPTQGGIVTLGLTYTFPNR